MELSRSDGGGGPRRQLTTRPVHHTIHVGEVVDHRKVPSVVGTHGAAGVAAVYKATAAAGGLSPAARRPSIPIGLMLPPLNREQQRTKPRLDGTHEMGSALEDEIDDENVTGPRNDFRESDGADVPSNSRARQQQQQAPSANLPPPSQPQLQHTRRKQTRPLRLVPVATKELLPSSAGPDAPVGFDTAANAAGRAGDDAADCSGLASGPAHFIGVKLVDEGLHEGKHTAEFMFSLPGAPAAVPRSKLLGHYDTARQAARERDLATVVMQLAGATRLNFPPQSYGVEDVMRMAHDLAARRVVPLGEADLLSQAKTHAAEYGIGSRALTTGAAGGTPVVAAPVDSDLGEGVAGAIRLAGLKRRPRLIASLYLMGLSSVKGDDSVVYDTDDEGVEGRRQLNNSQSLRPTSSSGAVVAGGLGTPFPTRPSAASVPHSSCQDTRGRGSRGGRGGRGSRGGRNGAAAASGSLAPVLLSTLLPQLPYFVPPLPPGHWRLQRWRQQQSDRRRGGAMQDPAGARPAGQEDAGRNEQQRQQAAPAAVSRKRGRPRLSVRSGGDAEGAEAEGRRRGVDGVQQAGLQQAGLQQAGAKRQRLAADMPARVGPAGSSGERVEGAGGRDGDGATQANRCGPGPSCTTVGGPGVSAQLLLAGLEPGTRLRVAVAMIPTEADAETTAAVDPEPKVAATGGASRGADVDVASIAIACGAPSSAAAQIPALDAADRLGRLLRLVISYEPCVWLRLQHAGRRGILQDAGGGVSATAAAAAGPPGAAVRGAAPVADGGGATSVGVDGAAPVADGGGATSVGVDGAAPPRKRSWAALVGAAAQLDVGGSGDFTGNQSDSGNEGCDGMLSPSSSQSQSPDWKPSNRGPSDPGSAGYGRQATHSAVAAAGVHAARTLPGVAWLRSSRDPELVVGGGAAGSEAQGDDAIATAATAVDGSGAGADAAGAAGRYVGVCPVLGSDVGPQAGGGGFYSVVPGGAMLWHTEPHRTAGEAARFYDQVCLGLMGGLAACHTNFPPASHSSAECQQAVARLHSLGLHPAVAVREAHGRALAAGCRLERPLGLPELQCRAEAVRVGGQRLVLAPPDLGLAATVNAGRRLTDATWGRSGAGAGQGSCRVRAPVQAAGGEATERVIQCRRCVREDGDMWGGLDERSAASLERGGAGGARLAAAADILRRLQRADAALFAEAVKLVAAESVEAARASVHLAEEAEAAAMHL